MYISITITIGYVSQIIKTLITSIVYFQQPTKVYQYQNDLTNYGGKLIIHQNNRDRYTIGVCNEQSLQIHVNWLTCQIVDMTDD